MYAGVSIWLLLIRFIIAVITAKPAAVKHAIKRKIITHLQAAVIPAMEFVYSFCMLPFCLLTLVFFVVPGNSHFSALEAADGKCNTKLSQITQDIASELYIQ